MVSELLYSATHSHRPFKNNVLLIQSAVGLCGFGSVCEPDSVLCEYYSDKVSLFDAPIMKPIVVIHFLPQPLYNESQSVLNLEVPLYSLVRGND